MESNLKPFHTTKLNDGARKALSLVFATIARALQLLEKVTPANSN